MSGARIDSADVVAVRRIPRIGSEEEVMVMRLRSYRALAIKSGGKLQLRSRNDNDFSIRYPAIAKALQAMPDETVIDGEIVALDGEGRPSFNLLQNYGSSKTPLIYYVFDVLVFSGKDMMGETLETRRALLENRIPPQVR